MMFGDLAKKLESAIDKGLGIDGDKAKEAIDSAHKEEGSLLDTALGKERAELVKQRAVEVVDKVKTVPAKAAATRRTAPKAVPAPDKFFEDMLSVDPIPAKKQETAPPQKAEEPPPEEAGGWDEGGIGDVDVDGDEGLFASDAAAARDFWAESEEPSERGLAEQADGDADAGVKPAASAAPHSAAPAAEVTEVAEDAAAVGMGKGEGGGGGEAAEPASEGASKACQPGAAGAVPAAGPVANGAPGESAEMSRLVQALGEKEEELRMAMDRETEANAMLDKLRSALGKSGQMLQEVTLEAEDKQQALEGAVREATERADKAEKALAEMRRANEEGAAATDQLREVNQAKEELYKEGQKLMQEKQGLEAVIKQLRKQLKEKDETMMQLREDEATSKEIITQLRAQLDAAGLSSKTTEEQMAQIRGMSHETAKKLQERERDKNSLLQKVASLESEVKSLSSERDTAVRRAEEAVKDAEETAKRTVERERRTMDKEATLKVEMLSDSLEGVQAAMRRQETQATAKEARLRADLEDMQQRCAEAEGRCQELSSAVPQSTRPLLRQIESLQAGFAEKQAVWEQVEANLRSRCSEAEAEARGAAERERLAQGRMKQHADGTEALQARVSAMQTDNARLGAELRSAREEADASRRGLQDVTAELEVHAAAAGKRQQELLDAKALQRRLQMEAEDKHTAERQAWEVEKEAMSTAIKNLEAAAATAAAANAAAPSSSSGVGADMRGGLPAAAVPLRVGSQKESNDPWAQPSPFERGGAGGWGGGAQHASLQARISSLERERDTLAEELGYAATARQKLEGELSQMAHLIGRISELESQQEHTLELLGDREEEIDDLKATVEEQRAVFKQALLTVTPQ